MIRLHNISLTAYLRTLIGDHTHMSIKIYFVLRHGRRRGCQHGTQDHRDTDTQTMALASEYSLPTTIPAEAPDTAASLKLPLPPLTGCDSGGKCGVPGVRGLLKNSLRGNQPTTDGSLKLHHLPFPQAQFQKNQESLGSFASFPNHLPPPLCIISETKQRRSEPNPSRFRPSGRKRKRNKVGCLRG
jgi:hypothetical protein